MQNKENTYGIDVDKAWGNLYSRLEKDRLLIYESKHSPNRKRKILLSWIAAAAVFAGVIFSILYFPHNRESSLLVLQNRENSATLVTTLQDGSTIYLATGATISYPPAFAQNQRKVELNGNALFSVAKDENRPFVIETNEGMTIEVVGTVFAVQSSPDKPFEVSVKQGKVNVHSKIDNHVVPLAAGETVQKNADGLNKFKITNPLVFSYFTEKMCFKDEKLNTIVHAINAVYGSPTVIADKSLNDRMLTVTFENDSVETMTHLICMALNLEQVNKQDTIFIRKLSK